MIAEAARKGAKAVPYDTLQVLQLQVDQLLGLLHTCTDAFPGALQDDPQTHQLRGLPIALQLESDILPVLLFFYALFLVDISSAGDTLPATRLSTRKIYIRAFCKSMLLKCTVCMLVGQHSLTICSQSLTRCVFCEDGLQSLQRVANSLDRSIVDAAKKLGLQHKKLPSRLWRIVRTKGVYNCVEDGRSIAQKFEIAQVYSHCCCRILRNILLLLLQHALTLNNSPIKFLFDCSLHFCTLSFHFGLVDLLLSWIHVENIV